MARFSREQIIQRLEKKVQSGRPIVGAGASSGLIAAAAVAGGADLVIVYNTGRTRLMGLPTSHHLNHANPTTMAMYQQIANVVTDTPIIGGAEAQDPTFADLGRLVDSFRDAGFDGLINFPTIGPFPEVGEDRALGYAREQEMVRQAAERDVFTACYAYDVEQAVGLAAAGADVLVPHAGWTTGGLVGSDASALSLEDSCAHVQSLIEAAREINPKILFLAHGGAISSPADTEYMYAHTDAQGFLGASSVERVPVEDAMRDAIQRWKGLRTTPFTATQPEEARS